jgi:hypothetical protein
MQVDLAGLRGQEVAALAVAVGIGEHRLAALFEALQRGGDLVQAGQASAAELVGVQQHGADLVVTGGLV